MSETKQRYGYTAQGGSGAGDYHYRVHDERDDRIATCYLEENARLIVNGLNERDRLIAEVARLKEELAGKERECGERDRKIFDAGFKAAVGYGDNFIHYRGEQADRVFASAMAVIAPAAEGGTP